MDYGTKIASEVEATTFSDPNFPTKALVNVGIVTCRNGSALGADFVLGEAMRCLFDAKSSRADRVAWRDLSAD